MATLHVHDHAHHGHAHGHDHAHGAHGGVPRERADPKVMRRLRWALVITSAFMIAELVGGILSNSLALLADAGHMLTDVGALALSLFVAWFSRQPETPQKTYGYLRWEVLAALINGAALLAITIAMMWEAVTRLRTPEPVAARGTV